MMKLESLIQSLNFRVLVSSRDTGKDMQYVYAGDRMSDLLCAASEDTVIVTHLATQSIVRLIELMDLPAICFLNGQQPGQEVLEAARDCNTCLIVSPLEMYETCGHFYKILNAEQQGIHST